MPNTDLALQELTAAHAQYEAAIAAVTAAEERIRHAMQALRMGDDGAQHVTVYGQRDQPWASDQLGFDGNTMASSGCLVSDVASILTDAGRVITPGDLNKWLKQNHGFVNGDDFVYSSVNPFGLIKFRTFVDCPDTPAPVAQLDAELVKGNYVLVKIKVSDKVPSHYLRWVGAGSVMDPYYADISPLVPRYRGRDAAQAILRYVIYDRGILG